MIFRASYSYLAVGDSGGYFQVSISKTILHTSTIHGIKSHQLTRLLLAEALHTRGGRSHGG
jgi:hypothetical protein